MSPPRGREVLKRHVRNLKFKIKNVWFVVFSMAICLSLFIYFCVSSYNSFPLNNLMITLTMPDIIISPTLKNTLYFTQKN